jgi:transcriptional regulator with GAF, ATPase, and Fis domain
MMNKIKKNNETAKEKNFKSGHVYNLSLYILIPGIFSGISVLSFLIALNISNYGISDLHSIVWILVMIVFAFLCGLLIMWQVLRPIKKFVETTGALPLFKRNSEEGEGRVQNELDQFDRVFKEVTEVLTKIEAKEFFSEIIGDSRIMRGLFSQILKVAGTDATVLIMGESGTGKELVATGIFNHSERDKKPFVKMNCVAIPEGLLESELFGYERGAFTGAISRKIGKFELADGGTIFLDEIGDMTLETQAKLLRVLEEREFERVGGTDTIKVDVRFIAASNKNLPKMVERGEFREDLYYRLNVFSLTLPPLREKKKDIPLLVDYFLENFKGSADISPEALQYLLNYQWPGNVRELRNTIERSALMADNGIILPSHLPEIMLTNSHGVDYDEPDDEDDDTGLPLKNMTIDDRLEEMEKNLIIDALRKARGIQKRAAEFLGIKERSLWHRVKKYNIDVNDLKKRNNG